MPIITANILSGRSAGQKREFIRSVTEAAVRTLDVQPGQVRVIINEVDPAHWAVGGISKADQGDQP
ncbi:MAG: 4-oxalocrotonate tautomerase family protein [Sphingobium sp.]